MQLNVEILNRYQPDLEAHHVLYTPVATGMTYRLARCYTLDYEGSVEAMNHFVRTVLLDEVRDELHAGEAPCCRDYLFYLDIGLKPGLLDLEQESIRSFALHHPASNWQLQTVRVGQRYYFRGTPNVPAQQFVQDMVNPVIHTWNLVHGPAA